jgi:hypothetical protein
VIGEHEAEHAEHHVTADDDREQPPRDDAAHREADERSEDEQPVGSGVEQLAKPALLIELAGDQPVEEVGDAREDQHEQRPAVVPGDDEHEEHRNQQQSREAQQIGNGENA